MEDASNWKYDVNTSFLTPLQLQIQRSFAFQCSSGNLFSKYVKTIAMYLISTNNHCSNHTDAVAIFSATAKSVLCMPHEISWKPPVTRRDLGGTGGGEGGGGVQILVYH